MCIVSGSNAEQEMKNFLVEYDQMNQAWDREGITDRSFGFFDNSFSITLPTPMLTDTTPSIISPPTSSTSTIELSDTPHPETTPSTIPDPAPSSSSSSTSIASNEGHRGASAASEDVQLPNHPLSAIGTELQPDIPDSAPSSSSTSTSVASNEGRRGASPASENEEGTEDVAAMINRAFVANDAANTVAQCAANDGVVYDEGGEMVLTIPGLEDLTPEARELTDSIIDQSQFPENVSPLTKFTRPHTPEPIDGPLTPDELQRLMRSKLALSGTCSPLTESEGEMDTDADAEFDVGDQINNVEEDVFMETHLDNSTAEVSSSEDGSEDGNDSGEDMDIDESPRQIIMQTSSSSPTNTIHPSQSNDATPNTPTPRRSAPQQDRQPPSTTRSATTRSMSARRNEPRVSDESSSSSDEDESEGETRQPEVLVPPKPVNPPIVAPATTEATGSRFGSKSTLEGSLRGLVQGPANLLKNPAVPVRILALMHSIHI
jgi:hypothetical protein